MKFIKAIAVFLIFEQFFTVSFAQKSQNSQFEKSKGKLPFPVCTVYRHNAISCKKCDIIPSPYSITFSTDSAAEVRAIYDGIIVRIFSLEDDYAVVTKFGDYYITYYPLTDPVLKRGDLVLCGQPISRIGSSDDAPVVNIVMSKTTTFIDPYRWFKW